MKGKAIMAAFLAFALFVYFQQAAAQQMNMQNQQQQGQVKSAMHDVPMIKELHTQFKEYFDNNILPQLKDWKEDLDKALTKEDLVRLNDLRDKTRDFRMQYASEVKTERHNYMGSDHEGMGTDHESMGTDHESMNHEAFDNSQPEMKKIINELKPIEKKYKSDCERISKMAASRSEQWRKDFKMILTNWQTKYASQIKEYKDSHPDEAKMFEEHITKMMDRMDKMDKMDKNAMLTGFLLWDGSENTMFQQAMMR